MNVPARCWVFLVTSPLPLRLLSLSVIAAIIYLVKRYRSHPALLPLLTGVNCLLVSFITFMALTIVSHLSQFIGAMGLPPYWPWFGR